MRHLAVVLAVVFVCAACARGHDGATGVVKERRDLMADMGRTMKKLITLTRPNEAFDGAEAEDLANRIGDQSRRIVALFPEGSVQHPSEARLEVWSNWEAFTRATALLSEETGKLVRIARSEDRKAFTTQVRAVGQACSDCHRDFRSKRPWD